MVCSSFFSTIAHRFPTEKNHEVLSFLGGLGVGGIGAKEEGTMQQPFIRGELRVKVHVSPLCGLSPWNGNVMEMQLWVVVLVPFL